MTALKLCPTCGSEYPANERFCPRDGTALRAQGGGNDLVGSIIADRYHVIRKLGEGGMGQVYLAEHVKMGRKSAVKVMNPGMVQDADAISRFNREAANASRINHQHVAGIYDFGETADGLIYLAMEYVEGEPLTDLVQRSGALPPARAAELTRQSGEALAVAHDMGIVHRDLKPDNIMVARNRDGSDCVKVVDFGIAKAANIEAQKVTRTGLVVGTPEYMSPEQLAGDPLDGRSDIYSLGLVAFNMLTGHLPFPSETVQESMIMRLTDRPKRLGEMRPEVSWPAEVQDVMDRALQRDAAERYGSASEFGRALQAAVRSIPAMPAPAARTVVGVGVPAGYTGVVPATRVSDPVPPPMAASAPTVTKAARKLPMIAGAGVGVLVVAALTAMFMSGRAAKSGTGTDATQAGVATPVADPPTNGGATMPSVGGARPSSGSRPVMTAVMTGSAGGTAAGVTPEQTGQSYGAALLALDESIKDPESAALAQQELDGWRKRVTLASDSAAIQFIRAHAAMFTSAVRGCSLMRQIKPEAIGDQLKKSYREGISACEGT